MENSSRIHFFIERGIHRMKLQNYHCKKSNLDLRFMENGDVYLKRKIKWNGYVIKKGGIKRELSIFWPTENIQKFYGLMF